MRLDTNELRVDTFDTSAATPAPGTPNPDPLGGTNTGCTGCGGCSEITCGYTVCNTKCTQCGGEVGGEGADVGHHL